MLKGIIYYLVEVCTKLWKSTKEKMFSSTRLEVGYDKDFIENDSGRDHIF